MVRSELVTKLAHQFPGVLRKDLKIIFYIIFSEITAALCRGEQVQIRGWGMLKVVNRKARQGINPKTKQPLSIKAKKAVKWKISKVFFNRLNKNFTENKISDTY